MNTDNRNNQVNFSEDGFDLVEHQKAAMEVTRLKAKQKRTKRSVFVGKLLLALFSLGLFAFLLVFAMQFLGLVARFPVGLIV